MTKEQRKQAPKEIVINIGEGDNAVKVHCYTVYGLSLTMPGRGGRGKLSTDYIYKALRKSPLPSVEYAGMRVFPKDKEFLKKVMAWILNDKTFAQEKAEMNAAYLEQPEGAEMKPYDVELDIGGIVLEVSGNYTPPREACKSGHPDTWEPEEPGELDITAVALDGNPLKCDLAAFKEAWAEQIWERL